MMNSMTNQGASAGTRTRRRRKVMRGARSVVAVLASVALAIALVPAAALQQAAWAADGETVSVEYWRIGQDSYEVIAPDNGGYWAYADYRDEIRLNVTFDEDLSRASENDSHPITPSVRGQFKLRPKAGGADIDVLYGTSEKNYGADLITLGNMVNDDGSRGKSVLYADIVFPETLSAGVYTPVMDLQFNYSYSYDGDFDSSWTPVQRYVTTDTLEIRRGEDPRPQIELKDPKIVCSNQKYSEKLSAKSSAPGNTIKWTCSLIDSSDPSMGTELEPYGLQLNDNGTITGKGAKVDFSQRFDFFATATEYDGDTMVGATSRKINMYITEQPSIVTYSADFSRGAAGIAPGSIIALQMRLSSESSRSQATAIVSYTNDEGQPATAEATFYQSDKSARAYAGETRIPSNAKSIQKVTFKADSVGAAEDKTVELTADEQALAPGLSVKVRKEADSQENAVLSEGMSSPFVKLIPQDGGEDDASRLWLETQDDWDEVQLQDLLSYETPAGTYSAQLFVFVDGQEQAIAAAQNVTLVAGEVADTLTFAMGTFTRVEPKVMADGTDVTTQWSVSKRIEWYSDESCQNRIATADARAWNNVTDTWVRAVPFDRSQFEYTPSDPVKLTAENAGNIVLSLPKRNTATVRGTVTKAAAASALSLASLTATLKVGSGWYARTFTSDVQSDGAYSFGGVPVGAGLDATLTISGHQIHTAQNSAVDLSTVSGGEVDLGAVEVALRQGVIGLKTPVNFADVEKGGAHLSATVSSDGQCIYLDDPSEVAENDVLSLRLYRGKSRELFGGGVYAYGETTAKVDANKWAQVQDQKMEDLGSISMNISNPNEKVFGALLERGDGTIVQAKTNRSGNSGIGTKQKKISADFLSVRKGTYKVLLVDLDAYKTLESAERATGARVKNALESRGANMYIESDDIKLAAGGSKSWAPTFPNSKPNAAPVDAGESSMQVTALGDKLYYRAHIARGKAPVPNGEDLNLIIKTTQSGKESSERLGHIAGSVVYINGTAATAKKLFDAGGTDDTGSVYLLPNSIRNNTDASASNGLYVVSIPAADLKSGKYGDVASGESLTVSFTAPRMNGGKVFASASVAFGNADWSAGHVDAASFIDSTLSSTAYNIGTCEYTNASITCQAPDNVTTTRFTVNGIAPTAADLKENSQIDIYLDGVKAASAAPNASTGLYNVSLELKDPFEFSTHTVSAKVTLKDGTVKTSAENKVLYSKNTAALESIEISNYAGSFETTWLNGEAMTGCWYYLPDKPTQYRLTFKKGEAAATDEDVSDVYVNVPHGTDTWRLKASYDGNGQWLTEPKEMGNTPPSGEWVTYQPTMPKAVITSDDAQKVQARLTAVGEENFGAVASEERTVTVQDADENDVIAMDLSQDGKELTFEGVKVTSAVQASGVLENKAQDWANALPANPWSTVDFTDETAKKALEDAGYISQWKLVDSSDNKPEEDAVEMTADGSGNVDVEGQFEAQGVHYVSLDNASAIEAGETATIYQRVGLLDESWSVPAPIEPSNADRGAAATDIVTKYAYEDGSGFVYERVTATRAKMVHTIADTKTGKVYTQTYACAPNGEGQVISDTSADMDDDGTPGTTDDKVAAINEGWALFLKDLAAMGQGVAPLTVDKVATSEGAAGTSAQSMSVKGSKRGSTLKGDPSSTGGSWLSWPWGSDKPKDYSGASNKAKLSALSAHARKYGLDPTMGTGSFGDFCRDHFNPEGGNNYNGGIDHRVMGKWASEGVKEAIETYAGYYEGYIYGYAANAAGLKGWTADLAADAGQRAVNKVKGAYGDATGNDGLDAFVDGLRYEYYMAIKAYNQWAPSNGHEPIPWDGFPFGSDLPDPRDEDKPADGDDNPNENPDDPKPTDEDNPSSLPDGEDYNPTGDAPTPGGDGPTGNAANVPNPTTKPGVIDPSGTVYSGVKENPVEGATATLYEVADDGTRTLWGAQQYGQVNPYTTDETGHYEWFVPEGKWSVSVAKNGYIPYTTGEGDGVGAAQTSGDGTWYMPVAPAQLDVNINLVKTEAPAIGEVAWSSEGIEIEFTQVMDESSVKNAVTLTRNGETVDCAVTVKTVEGAYGHVTKATVTPTVEPTSADVYSLEVGAGAQSNAETYGGIKRSGVAMAAGYVEALVPSVEALAASSSEQARTEAQGLVTSAQTTLDATPTSSDGSEYGADVKWVTSEAKAALQNAIDDLSAALGEDDIDAVKTAAASLRDAIAAFNAALKSGTKQAGGGGTGGGTGGDTGGSSVEPPTSIKAGGSYGYGSGASAAYYAVKKVATTSEPGEVWYSKPKSAKKIKTANIPASIVLDGRTYNVTGIAAKALSKCSKLAKVTVGSKVATVSKNAFNGSKKLKTFTLGAGVKSVGKGAFKGCKKLKKITVATKLLNKKSCKNVISGSKITTVKLKGAAKKAKKNYKKWFPKKNAGKKLKVS